MWCCSHPRPHSQIAALSVLWRGFPETRILMAEVDAHDLERWCGDVWLINFTETDHARGEFAAHWPTVELSFAAMSRCWAEFVLQLAANRWAARHKPCE